MLNRKTIKGFVTQVTQTTLCLVESAEHAQYELDRFSKTVAPFGMSFAFSKYKVLFQDWISVAGLDIRWRGTSTYRPFHLRQRHEEGWQHD